MSWFTQLFFGHGAAQSTVVLSLAVVIGIGIGRMHVCGVRLGVGGVLFSGLLLAHFGIRIDPEVLHFVREFGLILFVFTVGMQVGPGFVESMRRRGLFLNLAAALIVMLGSAGAVLCFFLFDLPLAAAIGLLSGAVTNTPSLAAASQVFSEITPGTAEAAVSTADMAYAIAYPCGILGILLTMLLVRARFHINPDAELEALKRQDALEHPPLLDRAFMVSNRKLSGMSLRAFFERYPSDALFCGLRDPDGGAARSASPDTVLRENMILYAVGREPQLEQLRALLGPACALPLAGERGPLITRRLLASESRAAGKSLHALALTPESGIMVTRIIRAGVESAASPEAHVHYGDRLICTGDEQSLARAGAVLGDSEKALDHPHLIPLFLGILLGAIFGSIPVPIPGLPSGIKLGLAGGPLIAAVILSRVNHFAGLVWYLPMGANLILREIGISLFLACVGLNTGAGFMTTLLSGSGLLWMAAGACITFFPLLIVAVLARIRLKYDYPSICGLLAGSMTDPPALAFSMQMLGSDAPSSIYAMVYPLTMILRILIAQILVLGLYYLS